MFWKIIKIWRRVRILLRIYSDKGKTEHYLFTLQRKISPETFYLILVPLGWHYDPFASQYRGQIFSVRKLNGIMMWHIRYYDDGSVSGHYEYNYEFYLKEHILGKAVRTMMLSEFAEIKAALKA